MSAIDLTPMGVQVEPRSKRRTPTTRLYATPLTDDAIARIRRRAQNKETPMIADDDCPKTEPAPAPTEDEHSHPVEPTRYVVESEEEGGVLLGAFGGRDDEESHFLTLPQIIEAYDDGPEILPATLDAIRMLAPGESHFVDGMGTVTRARRVRVVVAFEVLCLDAADPKDAIEQILDNGDPQTAINGSDRGIMFVDSAIVTGTEVQS